MKEGQIKTIVQHTTRSLEKEPREGVPAGGTGGRIVSPPNTTATAPVLPGWGGDNDLLDGGQHPIPSLPQRLRERGTL